MRRLIALAVTISLRVFLILTITIWWMAKTHFGELQILNVCLGFDNVGGFALTANRSTPCFFGWQTRSESHAQHYEKDFYRDYCVVNRVAGVLLRNGKWMNGWGFLYAKARHETLITVAVIGNVLHWLWWRRRRKAVPCDD